MQTFQASYEEDDLTKCDDLRNCARRRVGSYQLWDLQIRYAAFKTFKAAIGIKNLFDRAPPFTLFSPGLQVGYDSTYADPRGRSFYASITASFD
jgi:iron complex outermembrane receptor protein